MPQLPAWVADASTSVDRTTRGDLVRESLIVAAVAFLAALWVVRIWELDPNAPLLYEWDALLHLAYVENLREGGWYFWTHRLAAPFGQDVRDFPLGGENLHWLFLKLLGRVLPNAPSTVTAYLVLTYVLVAVATYVVARVLRLGVGAAAVVGLLFAFLPYHQMRWTMHLLRSGYYPVPLGALAILWVLDWRRELRDDGRRGQARWRRGRLAFVLASAALLGSSDTQNAFYATTLLVPMALLVSACDRDLRPLVVALGFGVIAGAALVANNLPYLLARAERGANPQVLTRTPQEQDFYGLRVAQLVLPVPGHRVAPLADVAAAAARWAPAAPGEAGQALGVVGTIGFVLGLAAVGVAALGRTLLPRAPLSLARLGAVMLAGVLWASAGGFAYLLSIAGLTNYRTWNRMSLWIALFALLAAGAALQRLLERIGDRRRAGLLVAALVVVGLLDQVPTEPRAFDPDRLASEWRLDAEFFTAVEATLPPGAMIFQLPAMAFPEPDAALELPPYEHLKAYLHTIRSRFSYGGMKGRPEGDWVESLAPLGPAASAALVALAGFDGALVERRGYADYGIAVEETMARSGALLATIDAGGQRSFWDLRPLRARLGGSSGPQSDIGQAVLGGAVRPRFDERFYWLEQDGAGHRWRWAADSAATIRFENDGPARRVVVTATIDHIDPAAAEVTISAPDTTVTLPIALGPAVLSTVLDVPPGGTSLRLAADGQPLQPPGDTRRLGLLVRDLVVADEVVLRRLCATDVAPAAACGALPH